MEETEGRVRWKQGQGLHPEEPQQFTVEPLQEVEPAEGTEGAAGEAENTRSVQCRGSQEQKVMGGGNSPPTLTLLGCQVREDERFVKAAGPQEGYLKFSLGPPQWLRAKESGCQCRRHGFDP